jgi:hypothetical protein
MSCWVREFGHRLYRDAQKRGRRETPEALHCQKSRTIQAPIGGPTQSKSGAQFAPVWPPWDGISGDGRPQPC